MWFKNLQIFRLLQTNSFSADALQSQLSQQPFIPCGELDLLKQGWVAPLSDVPEQWVYEANQCYLIKMRQQEKILPAAVVREYVDEKIEEIEAREQRKVRKKEKQSIRDEVMQQLLPRAFVRSSYLSAYLDTRHQWLIVDSASRKKAEAFTHFLRKTLGSLPIAPLQVQHAASRIMTEWLENHQHCPSDFLLADACELNDSQLDGATVNCKRQDLLAEEIQGHLSAGKRVSRLSLEWADKIRCAVDEEVIIKRLQFIDIKEENVDIQDEMQQFDTDFVLMTDSIAAFLQRLFDVFGGENEAAYATAQQNLHTEAVT